MSAQLLVFPNWHPEPVASGAAPWTVIVSRGEWPDHRYLVQIVSDSGRRTISSFASSKEAHAFVAIENRKRTLGGAA